MTTALAPSRYGNEVEPHRLGGRKRGQATEADGGASIKAGAEQQLSLPLTYSQQFVNWYLAGTPTAAQNEGTVRFRHGSRSNVHFADGHVESADRARTVALITLEYANPGLDIWGADADGAAIDLN